MQPADSEPEVTRIGVARARRLLQDIKDHPFIAFVFVDGEIAVYCKGMSEEDRSYLQAVIDEATA